MENCGKGAFTFAHFCQGSCTICRVLSMREAPINVVGANDVKKIVQLKKHLKRAHIPIATMASFAMENCDLTPLVHERAARRQNTNKAQARKPSHKRYLCAVCETTVKLGDMKKTACGDVFHAFCLSEWKKHNKKCPECRAKI